MAVVFPSTRRWLRKPLEGSHATPNEKGIDRLVDALSIHFDGVGFGSNDIGAHYEIACSDSGVAEKANEYIAGWLAK